MTIQPVEQRIMELEKEIQSLREEFQNFVYLVSHDLQAPFRSIIGFSRLIMENEAERLDARGQKHFAMVMKGGEKGQAMVDGLLQYSRVYTQAARPEKVDMNAVLRQALQALEPEIRLSGLTLEAGKLPTLLADKDQVHKLFICLLDNAMKFRREDVAPSVTITAENKSDEWWFSVTDNGIGIEHGAGEKVFEVFRRLHTEQEYPGIGMGLALARRIVERHGGNIEISPEITAGTRVVFTLPAVQAEMH